MVHLLPKLDRTVSLTNLGNVDMSNFSIVSNILLVVALSGFIGWASFALLV